MSFITSLWTDLRERRLWPVAVVLLACVVAVPVLLAKPAPSPSAAAAATAAPLVTAPAGSALPVVSVVAVHDHHLRGLQHNPFAQQPLHLPGAGKTSSSNGNHPATSSSANGTQPGTSGGGGGATRTTPAPSGTTTTTTPTPTPKPARESAPTPALLSETEAYHVAVSVTNSAGGVNAADPLQRLSPLPDASNPLLVELGVLRGGKRVLFRVQPGTTVSGRVSCTPGPLDCEVASVAPSKTVTVSGKASDGSSLSVQFAVTAIRIARYRSAGAAARARREVSKAGQQLLRRSSAPALSLFPYRQSLGAIVDTRNLSAGGS